MKSALAKKILILIGFAMLAVASWFANEQLIDIDLDKVFNTFVVISVAYLIFRIILEELVSRRIKDSKTRYSFRKTVGLLFLITSIVAIIRMWIIDPQALIVAYGLVAAGVAIALQDLFKNFAGGIVLFIGNIYHVGDRVEIDERFGDIIDISMFYTTLLETRGWVDGDQTTGRIINIPNGKVLSNIITNYTRDHNFIWDEFSVPVTFESNWQKAGEIMESIVKEETELLAEEARESLARLSRKYYISDRQTDPSVYIKFNDNWISINIRYVVRVWERRPKNNAIIIKILKALEKESDIKIASTTLTVNKPFDTK